MTDSDKDAALPSRDLSGAIERFAVLPNRAGSPVIQRKPCQLGKSFCL